MGARRLHVRRALDQHDADAALGGTLAWAVLTRVMEIPWENRPLAYAGAVAGTIALVVLVGLAASARAMASRPIEVLRTQ